MNRVLTLCIGNICRSPLAEVALRQALPGWEISSAGLKAMIGMPADPLSLAIAAEQGLDLSSHRAQQLAPWMCQRADVILVMEAEHVELVTQQNPTARGKVFRLGHVGKFDIADPYLQPREAFERAWAGITQGVTEWAPRLRRMA
jgi:protein-tyrosine phosphatase